MRGFLLSMAALLIVTAAWADPPEMSGAVVRFTESSLCQGDRDPWPCCTGAGEGSCNQFWFRMWDGPIFAMTGCTLPQLLDWCDGGTPFTQELEAQWVLLEEDVISMFESDDWPVFVYQFDPECFIGNNKANLCCHLEDKMPMVSGRVNVRAFDNHLYGPLTNRTNAWGIMYHGFVTVVATGESVPFSAHTRCHANYTQWTGKCKDKIQVD